MDVWFVSVCVSVVRFVFPGLVPLDPNEHCVLD